MQQITTRSIRQGRGSLWKPLLRLATPLVARLALALMSVFFMVGLLLAFVDQHTIAYAAQVQNTSQPTTYAQPTGRNEITGSALNAPSDSIMSMMHDMMSMMQKHGMVMPARNMTINGDVIVIVIKKIDVELESHF